MQELKKDKKNIMKIAYSWLKEYIDTDLTATQMAEILTQTGLEVAGVEKVESIKGGLRGIVIGEVVECIPHPNSDHLNVTRVNIGSGELLPIVCGAPNVAKNQKVLVATVGTTLYSGDESFVIRKAKLRGEPSVGMICSAKELNLGEDTSGIMVLPNDIAVGTLAKDYFNIKDDYVIEVDITPNRIDGASHYGVARDLVAYLKSRDKKVCYGLKSVENFTPTPSGVAVHIQVENTDSCPRYAGVTLSNVKVAPSPEWLQNRLKSIGLSPINNVVDVTNYVLFETGQPLHAFDRAVVGDNIIVKTMPQNTHFITLDGVERKLSNEDLMICSATEPMCIAGVFGGLKSGVTDSTTEIFLESAYFNPIQIRKTGRRHGLHTDASFRFERGIDPNMTIYALKRASLLIQELTGATISSEINDIYGKEMPGATVQLSINQVNRLTGITIPKEKIIQTLEALEINITEDNGDILLLKIPAYRVDVTREADVIEEILRIYGYNNIPVLSKVNSVLSYAKKPDTYQLKNKIGNYLSSNGFNEIMNNSLTKIAYYEDIKLFPKNEGVLIENPLSQDLGTLRRTLLFGGMENIAYNNKRKRSNLMFYEFGKTYHYNKNEANEHPIKDYSEFDKLGVFLTGNIEEESWNSNTNPTDFFRLKSFVYNTLELLGLDCSLLKEEYLENELFSEALCLTYDKKTVAVIGQVSKSVMKLTDVSQKVFFAEISWEELMKLLKNITVKFKEIPKYPEVRRDFALLLDDNISFSEVKQVIKNSERQLLKNINLFDVYTGDKLPKGKKSYAVSVILQDENATLNEKQIEKTHQKLQKAFEKQLGATLR